MGIFWQRFAQFSSLRWKIVRVQLRQTNRTTLPVVQRRLRDSTERILAIISMIYAFGSMVMQNMTRVKRINVYSERVTC